MRTILCFLIPAMLTAADAATRPNMIFIMADDLGWKDVGYAGADFFETPHIDKMRREGMRFDAAYSGGPNCAPTRGCLMTGTYTPRHHIYQPGGAAKGKPEYMKYLVPVRFVKRSESLKQQAAEQFPIRIGLDPGFTSLAEVLDQGGYKTARLGKWHLGDDVQGFHLSTTDGRGSMKDNFYGNIDVAESLTDRAVKFIEEQRQGPFFLYLSHWDVHTPWKARKQVVAKYRKKLNRIPVDQRRNFNPTYAAMIEAVDTSVGRVLDKVDELGLAENTLIVFTSDNGGIDKVSQLAPLRGEKGSLFEGGVRIPCVMRWTGKIQPDSSCDTPVTSVDYLPTFAGIGGVSLPDDQPVDGVDISPLMTGRDIPERAIFWHYPMYLSGKGLKIEMADGQTYSWRGFPSTSMRRGRFKMIEFHETDRAALYDLEDDPGEQRDLSEARPELARKMRAELDAWQKATQAPVPSMLNPDYIGRAR